MNTQLKEAKAPMDKLRIMIKVKDLDMDCYEKNHVQEIMSLKKGKDKRTKEFETLKVEFA